MHHDQKGFITGIHSWFNIWKSTNIIHHINRLKKKTYLIKSIQDKKFSAN